MGHSHDRSAYGVADGEFPGLSEYTRRVVGRETHKVDLPVGSDREAAAWCIYRQYAGRSDDAGGQLLVYGVTLIPRRVSLWREGSEKCVQG